MLIHTKKADDGPNKHITENDPELFSLNECGVNLAQQVKKHILKIPESINNHDKSD